MKETVLCGPDIKSRPLLPLPSTPPSNDIYDYISDYIQPGSPCEIQERTHYERRTVEFKELIITCVDVLQILPHLTFVDIDKPGKSSSGGSKQKDSCEENKNAPPLPPRITLDFDKPGRCSSGGAQKDSCEENKNAPPLPPRITLDFDKPGKSSSGGSKRKDSCEENINAPPLPSQRITLEKVEAENSDSETYDDCYLIATAHKEIKHLADADCDQLLIEKERFKRATERLQAELEHLEDIHQLKHVITEMGAKKVQLVRDVSKVDEKYFALREDILEGKVHMEVSDEQYSDKGLYSAKQLSQTTLEKETTRNEQVTDLPNDEYRQVVKPNRKFHSYKDSAYMSDMGTMYEEQETAED
ncbi:hypothetical protein MAR_012268 [Mya arenaria]|uniref:Uncharacterized protein n=1 Tax=Mya arenaria TaxID=6604 RepID=A0ABY7FZ57_MYAAR|nr:hypothetical protein MAR_012268 [Mya arenaria]